MIKRIQSDQLVLGMFIHDLDCGWMAHPFLVNQFSLTHHSEIEKIIQYGIRSVYIDTVRGLDAPGAPTEAEISEQLDLALAPVLQSAKKHAPRTALSDELVIAKRVLTEAQDVVQDILSDVRMGRQVELERIEPVVEKMIGSVLRNPGALSSLGRVKQKDRYTFQHSVNVGVLLVNFCQHLGLDNNLMRDAAIGGLLHDIGKMKTPDTILNKPGKLSDQEFAVMREHVTQGVNILSKVPGISAVSMAVASQHHEHMDGGGYPEGLKGSEITQLGQMAAIVDVYDALTSIRVYHSAMEPTQALRKLFEWSPRHFNIDLVQRFIQCIGIYPVGTLVRLDSDFIAVVIEESTTNLLRPVVRIVHNGKKNHPITPRDVDLAKPSVTDRIVGNESAEKWKINIRLYV
jgi:putative nucleotidyltransferase with HDIG domain